MQKILSGFLEYLTSLKGAPVWVKMVALLVLIALAVLSFSACSSTKGYVRSPTLSMEVEKGKILYRDSIYLIPHTGTTVKF